jgi:hypothetical protein
MWAVLRIRPRSAGDRRRAKANRLSHIVRGLPWADTAVLTTTRQFALRPWALAEITCCRATAARHSLAVSETRPMRGQADLPGLLALLLFPFPLLPLTRLIFFCSTTTLICLAVGVPRR